MFLKKTVLFIKIGGFLMNRYIFVAIMLLLPLLVFAGGAPEMETEIFLSQPPQYISPGNPATGKDILKIENIQISIDANAAIRRYELRVYNKRGEIIYSISEENLEGRGFFEELFDIGDLPSVTVPESMIWEGRDNSGSFVDDGEYFYQLYVRDSNDRQTSTAPLAVVVDRVQPEIVSLGSNLQVFSPNDDGKQDSISFFMQSGPAESWTLEVQNTGGLTIVSQTRVSEGDTAASDVLAPPEFDWDGRNSTGRLQDEGSYRFLLRGVDRAGNVAQQATDFILSSASANIELSIEGNNLYFSHNVRERMDFSISVNNTTGLESWKMEISDEEDIVFRRFSGSGGEIPLSLSFNGRGNPGRPEEDSMPLDDGEYRVLFSASYSNGNVSVSDPLNIIMDSSAPESYVVADSSPIGRDLDKPIYFGGSAKPYLTLDAGYELGVDWDVVGSYERGEEMIIPLSEFLEAGVRLPVSWDGRNPLTGEDFPDGAYRLFLRAVDAAGNEGVSNVARFIKDSASREGTSIDLSVPGEGLVRITPVVPVTEGIEHFILRLVNRDDGRPYFSRQVRQVLPYVDWQGRSNNNRPVPLGNYWADLDIKYLNGDNVIVRSAQAITMTDAGPVLDYIPPGDLQGYITLDDELFSPDGDGTNDIARIGLRSNSESISRWGVEIFDPRGNLFTRWGAEGSPPRVLLWDGRSSTGELVQSAADYTVLFTLRDGAGNQNMSSEVITVDILVIVDGDRLKINVPSIYFAGNTADLFDVGTEEQEQNLRTLRRLAVILNRYETYAIAVEGHAAQLLSGVAGQEEQTNTLIPLSRNRALEVKQALSILGVDWERMSVRGFGGSLPVVPHSDAENRWKNRRVEFILTGGREE